MVAVATEVTVTVARHQCCSGRPVRLTWLAVALLSNGLPWGRARFVDWSTSAVVIRIPCPGIAEVSVTVTGKLPDSDTDWLVALSVKLTGDSCGLTGPPPPPDLPQLTSVASPSNTNTFFMMHYHF